MSDPAAPPPELAPWWGGQPDAAPSPPARRRRSGRLTLVLAVVCVALAVVVAFLWIDWARQHRQLSSQNGLLSAARAAARDAQLQGRSLQAQLEAAQNLDTQRLAVMSAAKSAALDVGTYDYRHVDADFAKIHKRLTKKYQVTYDNAAGALKQSIIAAHGVSVASVPDVAVVKINIDSAAVLVFLDQKITTSAAPTKTVSSRVDLTMERDGNGPWLVSNLVLV